MKKFFLFSFAAPEPSMNSASRPLPTPQPALFRAANLQPFRNTTTLFFAFFSRIFKVVFKSLIIRLLQEQLFLKKVLNLID